MFARPRLVVVLAFLLGLGAQASGAGEQARGLDHSGWTSLLSRHVIVSEDGHNSLVDYTGFLSEQAALSGYLDELSAVSAAQYGNFTRDEKLAYLINAYNAFTLSLILDHHPGIESIRDIGTWFQSPWQRDFVPLLGRALSLDDVETMLRDPAEFNEPRIHFAINCASISCPMLRAEAYLAEQLETQLADQTARFLSDRRRNRYDADANTLYVSRIFDWYRGDFAAFTGGGGLAAYFASHSAVLVDGALAESADSIGSAAIRYTEYDWRLNSLEGVSR